MVSSKNYVVIVPLLACYVGGFFDSGGVLLVSADDYDMFRDPATLRHWGRPLQSLLVTMYAFAVLLVLLEDVFFKPIFHSLLPKGAVSGQQMCVMARYASDGAAMLVFSYLGYAGLNDMGGWDTFWTASSFAKMNSFNALGLQVVVLTACASYACAICFRAM